MFFAQNNMDPPFLFFCTAILVDTSKQKHTSSPIFVICPPPQKKNPHVFYFLGGANATPAGAMQRCAGGEAGLPEAHGEPPGARGMRTGGGRVGVAGGPGGPVGFGWVVWVFLFFLCFPPCW